MADVTITAANVVPGANSRQVQGIAGETITAGQTVYKAAATGKWMKSDANSGTAEAQAVGGIALTGSSLNQAIVVHVGGDLTMGGTLVAGSGYYLSATAGGIAPVGDLTTGYAVVQLGLAKSTSVLAVDIQSPGVTL